MYVQRSLKWDTENRMQFVVVVVKLKFVKSKRFVLQKTSLRKQKVNNEFVENTHKIYIRQRTYIQNM